MKTAPGCVNHRASYFLRAIALLAAALPLPCRSSPLSLHDQQIFEYQQQLMLVAKVVTDHDYVSDYIKYYYHKENGVGACSPNTFCNISKIVSILSSIQSMHFQFIGPRILPIDGRDLLSKLRSISACNNLAVLNINKLSGETDSEPVPLRPTQGFGIYNLPITKQTILLVRGQNYNLAWSFWGADEFGDHLPPAPLKNTPGPDFLFELDAKSCSVIKVIEFVGLHQSPDNTERGDAFSEPLILDHQLFILQIIIAGHSTLTPTYDFHIVKLNLNDGRQVGDLFFSGSF